MSEQYFLEKCILTAEDAVGSYTMMANLDVEPKAKQMYKDMVNDATRHLHNLNNRLKYLKQLNQSNTQNQE